MSRWLVSIGFALALGTVPFHVQVGPRRGTIKKLDLEQRVLNLTVDGNDEEFQLAEDAQVLGASGKNLQGYPPEESDFASDRTHHAGPGVGKMGVLLLQFFQTDSTARPWFVRP